MSKANRDAYDVIIIGAGISGLVCGCYLAKAGMRVLIAEQHNKPGGYCTSFKRQRFTFDAAANSLGGLKHGILGKVIREHNIDKVCHFLRFNPSGIIITPDSKISLWNTLQETITEFQSSFPDESEAIENFFHFITSPDPRFLVRMRRWTFKDILDKYFKGEKIKAILPFPLFGNTGLPPSQLSAFLGLSILKEYILDGGYYPKGGMQLLADALAERFIEYGGKLQLCRLARKIDVKDGRVAGVVLDKEGFIPSRYVVSNGDARRTFFSLLDKGHVNAEYLDKIRILVPSASMFIIYLGLKENLNNDVLVPGVNTWLLSRYDLDNAYPASKKWSTKKITEYLLHKSPDKRCITGLTFAPFRDRKYWKMYKPKLLDIFIRQIETDLSTGLSQQVVFKDAATPQTLQRYTLNYRGAAYGWAALPSQFAHSDLKKPPFINGLYLTGHWSTFGLGIPGVTYVGYDIAKTILRGKQLIKS